MQTYQTPDQKDLTAYIRFRHPTRSAHKANAGNTLILFPVTFVALAKLRQGPPLLENWRPNLYPSADVQYFETANRVK